jgi:hypothetical protein
MGQIRFDPINLPLQERALNQIDHLLIGRHSGSE